MTQYALLDLDPRSPGFAPTLETAGIQAIPISTPSLIPSFVRIIVLSCGPRVGVAEEICAQLHRRAEHCSIIALLNEDLFHLAPKLIRAGARDCVRLPVHPEDLRLRLESHASWQAERSVSAGEAEEPQSGRTGLSPDGLALILQSINPLASLTTDIDGRIHSFNHAAELLLGCPERVARARNSAADFMSRPAEFEHLRSNLLVQEPGTIQVLELSLRSVNGDLIPVTLHASGIWAESRKLRGLLLMAVDQRERNAQEHRVDKATQQLIAIQKRLRALDEIERMVHELKQPLTVVMGILEMVVETESIAEPVRQKLERAYQQLFRLADIVRAFSRIPGMKGSSAAGTESMPLPAEKTSK